MAKNATFLFQRDFMDYHSDRFDDFSVMIYKRKKLVAIIPANRVDREVYSHQGLTYGGVVLTRKSSLIDAIVAIQAALKFYHENGIDTLDIKVIPSYYNQLPSDEVIFALSKFDTTLKNRDVIMVLDYRNLMPYKGNRKQGVNRAERAGLEIRKENDFSKFWNKILIPNLQAKHNTKPVHSIEEITLLASRFPDKIEQLNVYDKSGKLVAGTTVFVTETTIHPQYISGDADKNELGSLDFLYHYLINEYHKNKWYFDFNTSSESGGAVLNSGLIFWKETCGARPWAIDNYLVKTASYDQLNLKIK